MKLFIDDTRIPSDVGLVNKDWVIVRTYDQAILMLANLRVDEISFDHDLADFSDVNQKELTGYDVAKWIVENDQMVTYSEENPNKLTGRIFGAKSASFQIIKPHFKFNVHSANPVGKKNIESLLNNYIKHKFGE